MSEIEKIADRIAAMRHALARGEEPSDSLEFIERDLRGIKCVLPQEVTNELIVKSPFGLMVRGFNNMGFDARLGDVLTDVKDSPSAALAALAEKITKETK